MNEQDTRNPEQYVLPRKEELRPGETARFLEQNTELPLKSAEEMRKLTGIDLPATMAIEFDDGPETRQLLVVPVGPDNKDFRADYLLVNPDLMAPDDPDSLAASIGLKGLRMHEGGVKFGAGDTHEDERVNARLGLHASKSPNFRMQVDDDGKLHISVNPNSPQKIRLVQPVPAERPTQEQSAPGHREQVGELDQPTVSLTMEQRLSPESVERPPEPSANEIFASPEAFMAALDNKDLSRSTRQELIQIMSLSDRRESTQRITELWESSLGEPLRDQLGPLAKSALQEGVYLNGSFDSLESLTRRTIDNPEQAARNLDELSDELQRLAAMLEQQSQSDQFLEKAAEFMQHDGRLAEVQTALVVPRTADDPVRLEALVASRKPEEKELADMRLRLKDEFDEEPGAMLVDQRGEALLAVSEASTHPLPNNVELAVALRDLSFNIHNGGGVESVRQLLNSGGLDRIGLGIKTKLHRAQSVVGAFA